MTWKKKLSIINGYLQKSNLVRLNIITDNDGYVVRNEILKKNLTMLLDFVSEIYLENIRKIFLKIDNKKEDTNKNLKIFIISSLIRDLPTRI